MGFLSGFSKVGFVENYGLSPLCVAWPGRRGPYIKNCEITPKITTKKISRCHGFLLFRRFTLRRPRNLEKWAFTLKFEWMGGGKNFQFLFCLTDTNRQNFCYWIMKESILTFIFFFLSSTESKSIWSLKLTFFRHLLYVVGLIYFTRWLL